MATQLSNYLNNAYAVVLVVLGLGFVIFIHELGHFVMAKWAGVKVEMFSIGFGPTLVSWRKGLGLRLGSSVKDYEALHKAEAEGLQSRDLSTVGETEYSIRALPLGGFVKMLGEDASDPANKISDPRAYHNKPVGARMAIISAGVIMNLIFGLLCATVVYLRGTSEIPAVVGSVVAGEPAYEAGVRRGDEIVAIDGRTDVSFKDLTQAVMLSGTDQKIRFDFKRSGQDDLIRLAIEPRRAAKAQAPRIGIKNAQSLQLIPEFPKGKEPAGDALVLDRVTAAGVPGESPHDVSQMEDLLPILVRDRDKPLVLRIVADPADGKGAGTPKPGGERTVAPRPFRDLGLRMTAGPVAAIRPDSPASRAGFRKGDLLVSVDGKADFDPIRLPDLAYKNAGKPMTFEVRRRVEGQDATIPLTVTPDDSPIWTEAQEPAEPLEIPGLGLAIEVEPRVAAVAPGSTAEKEGLRPGDGLAFVRFADPAKTGDAAWLKPVPLDGQTAAWPWVFGEIQDYDGPVRVETDKGKVFTLKAEPVPDWFNPMRDLHFASLERALPPQPLGVSIRKGWRDTQDVALSIFGVIRGLFQQRLGSGTLGGPVKIGEWGFRIAKGGGLAALITFLGILSVNLAVMNFLPIPPLDGGQMTFLIAEKIRGRPLPENAVLYPTIVGISFVLLLFVFIFYKDVMSYF